MKAFFFLSIAAVLYGCQPAEKTTVEGDPLNCKLYYMGGQSNMEGFGYNKDLPASLKGTIDGAYIFHGNIEEDGSERGGLGMWSNMKPGHGTGHHSDGVCEVFGNRFGPELSFAMRMRELEPEHNVAVIKYARGGTSLMTGSGWGNWDPSEEGINQYDHFRTTFQGAMSNPDVNGDGVVDNLIPAGIIWMQGEADGQHKNATLAYEENLTELMHLIRKESGSDKIPVVIGKIVDSGKDDDGVLIEFIDGIHAAQEAFAAKDCCAATVESTKDYGFLPDGWHYLSENYIDLGQKFAEANHELNSKLELSTD